MPAEIESIIQPDPAAGKFDMSITAVIKETRVFGPNLELRRTISGTLGQPTIKIHDVVTNKSNTAQPHMMLYHCNYGWPLIDEGTKIIYKGKCVSRGNPRRRRYLQFKARLQNLPKTARKPSRLRRGLRSY